MDMKMIQAVGATSATAPKSETGGGALGKAASGFADALKEAETQAEAAVTTGADPHAMVTALAEAELAIDTVVSIRDRVVEAYQEILRMPV